MKSDLFASENLAQPSAAPGMTLQNAKSVKYTVNGEMLARQGSMVAFRGNLQFERKGQGIGGMLKRAVTGEGLPLMSVRGQGEAWFAHQAGYCFVIDLSTLLRIVAGIDTPSEGRITGRPRRTAYVPERFPAALPLTASAYLTHMGRVHGLRRTQAADRAARWLERFGAAAYAQTPLAELSKGSSQKVAVAQALLAEPGLLVLDEAWTGLDAPARAELDRAVAERTAAGGTVVFVDHDPERLAGAAEAHHRVEGAALVPVRAPAEAAGAGPRVRIEAAGPPGAEPPPGLAAAPALGGGLLLTVPAARSDAVLRDLLTAPEPWHIRAVEELP